MVADLVSVFNKDGTGFFIQMAPLKTARGFQEKDGFFFPHGETGPLKGSRKTRVGLNFFREPDSSTKTGLFSATLQGRGKKVQGQWRIARMVWTLA